MPSKCRFVLIRGRCIFRGPKAVLKGIYDELGFRPNLASQSKWSNTAKLKWLIANKTLPVIQAIRVIRDKVHYRKPRREFVKTVRRLTDFGMFSLGGKPKPPKPYKLFRNNGRGPRRNQPSPPERTPSQRAHDLETLQRRIADLQPSQPAQQAVYTYNIFGSGLNITSTIIGPPNDPFNPTR